MARVLMFVTVLSSCLVLAAGSGLASSVPTVLTYHSVIYDDGGNLIADGDVDATFKVLDADGAVLYEEAQRLQSVHGSVSALIGAGTDADSAPTGGIPREVLRPDGPIYLEVEIVGLPPLGPMEISSVPYAYYAGYAFATADGAVDSKSITDGSIAFDDLSSELVNRLEERFTGGRGMGQIVYREELDTIQREPSTAATIGVRPVFTYSGASELQSVLQDFDRAIKQRDERVVAESEARVAAVNGIQTSINNEAVARQNADNVLQININNEVSARQAADSSLGGRIDAEATERVLQDDLLRASITALGDTVAPLTQQIHISAWGSVFDPGVGSSLALRGGGNVSIDEGECDRSTFSVNGCKFDFIVKMPNENYALISSDGVVISKTAASFKIRNASSFDFIVVGP